MTSPLTLLHLRLDGGIAGDDGMSSSASLPRFRPLLIAGRPLFPADMLGRKGELHKVSECR
jgi:hypothetical protein